MGFQYWSLRAVLQRSGLRERVLDHADAALNAVRRLAVGDVEGDEEREAGVADGHDGRVVGEAPGEHPRVLLLTLEAHPERLQTAKEEPRGVGGGDDACEPPGPVQAV